MRKDTSFSDRKLTIEEFSKKYWRNGKSPYQYHTAGIEDARDEREQFVFNNIRALKDRMRLNSERQNRNHDRMWQRIIKNERKLGKLTFIVAISVFVQILDTLWNKRC